MIYPYEWVRIFNVSSYSIKIKHPKAKETLKYMVRKDKFLFVAVPDISLLQY
jgi:ABC-type uncharacterized transport system ATPase subunit